MKLEPLCNGGATLEVFEIATGRAVLDDSRDTPRSSVIYIRRVKPTSEGDASELARWRAALPTRLVGPQGRRGVGEAQ